MRLDPLGAAELPEVARFFAELGRRFPQPNLEQFVRPRRDRSGRTVGTRVLRDADDGPILGTLGYLDLPLELGAARHVCRWPTNFFLVPALRGHGLGKWLMTTVMAEAPLGLVLGGNERSIPVLERTGWRRLGTLTSYRWRGGRAAGAEKARPGGVEARRGIGRRAPWAAAGGREGRTPRSPGGLAFAFGGPLAPYHAVHRVLADGRLVGCFCLAARAGAPGGGAAAEAEIVDFDAVADAEDVVAAAALDAARRLAPEVVAHASARRFRAAWSALAPTAETPGLPLWIYDPEAGISAMGAMGAIGAMGAAADWHVTHGDHDRYRVGPRSLRLSDDRLLEW